MCSLFSDTLISSKDVLHQPAQHARQCPSGPTKQHPPVCSTHSCLPTYLTGYDDSPATVAIRQLSGPYFFFTWTGNLIILLTVKLCSFCMIVQLSNSLSFSIVVPPPLHAPDPAILCIQRNCRLLHWKQSS